MVHSRHFIASVFVVFAGLSLAGCAGSDPEGETLASIENAGDELVAPPRPPKPGLIKCGGFAGLPCPRGYTCVDDPRDDCSPCRGGADCGGICVEVECSAQCDPTLICTQALTCVDGLLYPTGCGPRNCDKPLGPCNEAQ